VVEVLTVLDEGGSGFAAYLSQVLVVTMQWNSKGGMDLKSEWLILYVG
jgi:hypothetical protein